MHSSAPRSTGFGRYSQRAVTFFLAPNIPGLAGGNSNGTLYARTRQIAAGYNFTPNAKSILQLRLGLTWTESGKSPINLGAENLLKEFNIPNIPDDPSINGGLNTQSVTGYSQFGRQSTNPQFTNPYLANPKVNYGFLKGRNSFKVGYEYGYLEIAISDFHPQFGADTYAGQFSRNTAAQATDVVHRQAYNLADFLLGARSHYELNNLAEINYERRWHMGYIQDDYKASDKLTLNLGLRYELVTPELGAAQPARQLRSHDQYAGPGVWRLTLQPHADQSEHQELRSEGWLRLPGHADDGDPRRLRNRLSSLLPLWR